MFCVCFCMLLITQHFAACICIQWVLSPRGQSGLEAKILASASKIWPRPGLDLVVLLCNRAFSGKNRVKFRNFVNFSSNRMLNRMSLIIIWCFFHITFGLGLGLNLQKLASASVSKLWPRPRPRPLDFGLV